jgi:hypothetical protein
MTLLNYRDDLIKKLIGLAALDQHVGRWVVPIAQLIHGCDPIIVDESDLAEVRLFDLRHLSKPVTPCLFFLIVSTATSLGPSHKLWMVGVSVIELFDRIPAPLIRLDPCPVLSNYKGELVDTQVSVEAIIAPPRIRSERFRINGIRIVG